MATRFQKYKAQWRMIRQLDAHEFNRLVIEAFITALAMIMIYFGCVFLIGKLLNPSPTDFARTWQLKERLGITQDMVVWGRSVFTFMMLIISLWFIRWRLVRRYRHIELRHLLKELDYIADGHYEHRISENLVGRLGSVALSINKLVDSTLAAMEEERLVEQTKNELIANVSHDIRTPLTSVIGYLGLLEDKQYENEEELAQYIHIAYIKSQQMKKLSDNLFEYIRVHNYKENLNYQTISINHFLTQIAAEYEVEALNLNMQIYVDVHPEYLTMRIDAEKMARVYDNLLSNAFKYSRATEIHLIARVVDNFIELRVENNGDKIHAEALGKLFTRFFREEQSRSSQTGGTGLGLSIVESIVHLHQGQVYAESDCQKTVFIIRLKKHI
ncbi:cell wall metabolism sensor histidine kinase WalK [Granulicatella sp. 19428wC4_WM01]|uniref:sensor histidine kinase n=1 Tax=Granulicatella sp. 19428wC4_WM01 TaxID=2782471 RepID=UPI0011027D4A|nr:HAMP domain-containing sensor histidine kinase [Granulicatella sp. 19428wC4_WM01]MBF0780424.1 HAMP domain-containing histidine kinase [Granulicatella sp. 19428wC4_WM01]TFU95413.1 HAMP domain-containing histidine kinase [Granulicatella sp. WM01]